MKKIYIILILLVLGANAWGQNNKEKRERTDGDEIAMRPPKDGRSFSIGDAPGAIFGYGKLVVAMKEPGAKDVIREAEIVITSGKKQIKGFVGIDDRYAVIDYPFKDSVDLKITHPDYKPFAERVLLKPNNWIFVHLTK